MTLITSPGHGISLGGLQLMSAGKPVVSPAGYTVEVSRDGTTWGNPNIVVSTLISEFSSGDLVEEQHVGNREPVLYVRLSSSTHAGLVAGDAALSAVVGGPEELVWQPPDPAAPVTVYDVVHSRMDHAWDDWDAVNRRRVWVVTMSALPWARSASKVITPAVTASAPIVVDDGTATTGWTAPAPAGATVSVVSDDVRSTYNPSVTMGGGFYGTYLRRAAAINTSANKYIGIDWKASIASVHALKINDSPYGNETEVRREPLAGGYNRSWYRVADSITSVTVFNFTVIHPSNAAASATLDIDQVLLANALPASGTTRQKISTIFPGGSVPAEGTILIQDATAGLGHVVVYSHPAIGGYSPPLRQWKSGGAADTADAALVSGAFTNISPTLKFSVPWSAIPAGDCQLWARMYRNTAATVRISWAAYGTFAGFANAVGNSMAGYTDVVFAANTWQMVPLGRFTSPPVALGPAGQLRIDIAGDSVVVLDEAWIFAMDRGTLTVVDNFTGVAALGGAANRLRVAAPSLSEPLGALMAGYSADWSDSHTATANNVACDQVSHRFDPNGHMIFTVTSGTLDAAVSLEHHPRWRGEAGT